MAVKRKHQFLMVAVSCLAGFIAVETGIRFFSRTDADGNRYFRNLRLKPYHLPVERSRKLIREYQGAQAGARLIYDPVLGWKPQPGVGGFNGHGFFSSTPDPGPNPVAGRVRIALFGGSFTAGGADQGWWKVVDSQVNAQGLKAEILNFGVGGYAIDQAYLRWKQQGAGFHPQIVIYGFSSCFCYDDLNFLRMIKDPSSGIPFAKPRFTLDSKNELQLLNVPTPKPEDVTAFVAGLEKWPLLPYEYFFDPSDYRASPWRKILLFSLIEAKINAIKPRYVRPSAHDKAVTSLFVDPSLEPARLAVEILKQFKKEVEDSGGIFLMVHLPSVPDLAWLRDKKTLPFASLLDSMQKIAPVIQPESRMFETMGGREFSSFFNDGHYREELNDAVGKTVASFLIEHFDSNGRPIQPALNAQADQKPAH